MKEVTGNIWNYSNQGAIIIPTNLSVNKQRLAVMGKGLAAQASQRFPNLAKELGVKILTNQGVVHFPIYNIICFPVKNFWALNADPLIIEESLKSLETLLKENSKLQAFMPRIGCGNGRLSWAFVKPLVEKYYTEQITLVRL